MSFRNSQPAQHSQPASTAQHTAQHAAQHNQSARVHDITWHGMNKRMSKEANKQPQALKQALATARPMLPGTRIPATPHWRPLTGNSLCGARSASTTPLATALPPATGLPLESSPTARCGPRLTMTRVGDAPLLGDGRHANHGVPSSIINGIAANLLRRSVWNCPNHLRFA